MNSEYLLKGNFSVDFVRMFSKVKTVNLSYNVLLIENLFMKKFLLRLKRLKAILTILKQKVLKRRHGHQNYPAKSKIKNKFS